MDCPRETIVYEMLDRLHLEEPSGSAPERLTSLTERRAKEASFGHATPAGTSSDTLAGTPQIPHTLPSRGTTPRPVFTETPDPDPQRNQGDGRNSNPWYTQNTPNPMTGTHSSSSVALPAQLSHHLLPQHPSMDSSYSGGGKE